MTTEQAIVLGNKVLEANSDSESGTIPEFEFEIVNARLQEKGITLLFSEISDYLIDMPVQLLVAAAFNCANELQMKLRVTAVSGKEIPSSLWTFAKIYRSRQINPVIEFLRKGTAENALPFAVSQHETFVVTDAALLSTLVKHCEPHQIILMLCPQETSETFLGKITSVPNEAIQQFRYIVSQNAELISQLNVDPTRVYKIDINCPDGLRNFFQPTHLNTSALEAFISHSI